MLIITLRFIPLSKLMDFTDVHAPMVKRIARVAYDHMKPVLSKWCNSHKTELLKHSLFATVTTASKMVYDTQLGVSPLLSGPMGGDQQIGAKIAECQPEHRRLFAQFAINDAKFRVPCTR